MQLARLFRYLLILFSILGLSAEDTEELMSPDVERQIKECADACQVYRSALYKFLVEMKPETWSLAQKEFTTCQWKCHRCTLQEAIIAMKSIDRFSPAFIPESSRHIRYKQTAIIPAITECVERWNDSAIFGCDRNPVEEYTSGCVI